MVHNRPLCGIHGQVTEHVGLTMVIVRTFDKLLDTMTKKTDISTKNNKEHVKIPIPKHFDVNTSLNLFA